MVVNGENSFYVIRTVVGQEYNVALLVEVRARSKGYPLKSIIVIDDSYRLGLL